MTDRPPVPPKQRIPNPEGGSLLNLANLLMAKKISADKQWHLLMGNFL